jgi:hypothetical protein
MGYGTLMVYVGLGRPNNNLLQVAGDLAIQFQAGVIGVAARQPARVGVGEGFVFWEDFSIAPEVDCSEIESAEAEFRSSLQCRVGSLEWRSAGMCASIADYLAHEVRRADILVIDIAADVFNSNRRVNTRDFVMHLGRPVIIVPTVTDTAEVSTGEGGGIGAAGESQRATAALASLDRPSRMGIGQTVGRVG